MISVLPRRWARRPSMTANPSRRASDEIDDQENRRAEALEDPRGLFAVARHQHAGLEGSDRVEAHRSALDVGIRHEHVGKLDPVGVAARRVRQRPGVASTLDIRRAPCGSSPAAQDGLAPTASERERSSCRRPSPDRGRGRRGGVRSAGVSPASITATPTLIVSVGRIGATGSPRNSEMRRRIRSAQAAALAWSVLGIRIANSSPP